MTDQITVGAAVLAATVTFGAISTRMILAPVPHRGRHRARRMQPASVESLVEVTVRCRYEDRDRRHAATRVTGELVCLSCGHLNTTTATVKGD
ncbi:hypothetical protein [Streptomyces sp. NPDC004324]